MKKKEIIKAVGVTALRDIFEVKYPENSKLLTDSLDWRFDVGVIFDSPYNRSLLLKVDGKNAGFILAVENMYHLKIVEIYIKDEYRGYSFSSDLYKALYDWSINDSIEEVLFVEKTANREGINSILSFAEKYNIHGWHKVDENGDKMFHRFTIKREK